MKHPLLFTLALLIGLNLFAATDACPVVPRVNSFRAASGGVLKDVLQFDAETNDDLLLQTAEKVLEAETKLQFWWQTRERSYVLRKGAYAAPV